jgi:hypothetical protein
MNSEAVQAATAAGTKAVAAAAETTGQAAKPEPAPKKKKHLARRPSREDGQRYAWRPGESAAFGGGFIFGRF